jgi:hypothetical protein
VALDTTMLYAIGIAVRCGGGYSHNLLHVSKVYPKDGEDRAAERFTSNYKSKDETNLT